jgi:hypothetical protein
VKNMSPAFASALPTCLAVLNTDACALICEKLMNMDAFWLSRHAELPFYTLGATNYYDISANPARPYAQLARKYNPFMRTEFALMYQALLQTLRQYLNAEVEFLADAALPGFHIFQGHPALREDASADVMHASWFTRRDANAFPGNPIHVDSAHLAVGLPEFSDGGKLPTLSFTLAIALPKTGAGLRIWPLTTADTQALDEHEKLALLQATPYHSEVYQCGKLFLHSGDFYHQARGLPIDPDDYRITLQGHAAWWRQRWRLFW